MVALNVKDSRGTLSERLERNLIPEPNSGCFLWLGTVSGGYGRIMAYRRGQIGTHRVAYELANGPIPEGMDVLHRCDVPICCNPDHLFLGTHADNMRDMSRKGRCPTATGAANSQSKLTEDQVREIFSASGKQKTIALRYGTTQTNVSAIKRRVVWKHLGLMIAGLLFCGQRAEAQQQTFVYTPLGYQQITAVPTGTVLTVPTGARMAQICVSTQAIRYRDDGTAPTASVGYPVAAATCFTYSGSLPAITFIQQTGTAVLDVLYYR